MTDLRNKIVCITGASAGIGEACARAFARAGSRLLLCARRLERLQELAPELRELGAPDIYPFALDVQDRAAVEQRFGGLPEEWRGIDILVNNAGLSRGLDTIQEGSIDDWEEMIDTNVKGLLYVSRAILPGMVARATGHVINIGSIAGHEVYPKGNVYCGTKHAVGAITKGMQLDLLGTGVRATTVDPGMVETEFSRVRFHGDDERAASVYRGLAPLTGEDVADAVLYCATRPAHVNVHEMILMPSAQASATMTHRTA
jgi:NADP-dependent 3-hydroxy acid dehydrogenase YdfG